MGASMNISTKDYSWLLNRRSPNEQIVGVIGAGTMGAGIAQVAAAAGHPVYLMDVRVGAAAEAREKIGAALQTLVTKGRMSAPERESLLNRITPVDKISQLSDSSIVIEVIIENLQTKQTLLRELETQLSSDAIIASNTSSISITALANGMQRPERLVGMHFFNPVPLMKLVEVVSGAETETGVAELIYELAKRWGKTPVHAKSTPGFIVNRIARPFYAETLALLQEQAATPADLDRAMRGAGFRMGPCELMDLIGHDINYSVTVSVFEANYGDRRFVPSLVQKALVDGGRLGRKSGKGFYDAVSAERTPPATATFDGQVSVIGTGPSVERLAEHFTAVHIPVSCKSERDWVGLEVAGIDLHITDGRTANESAARYGKRTTGVIDLPLLAGKEVGLAVAFAHGVTEQERAQVVAALSSCSIQAIELRDVPGLAVARTVAMLVNEAADAVYQGVCDEQGADLAMKLGTNYPAGPFEWLAQIGTDHVVEILNNLYVYYRSERYRVSPLLQQRYWIARSS
jgi:3-hydroxybutyryl-CoA dehydrogenase